MSDLWRAPGPQPIEVDGSRVQYAGQAAADLAVVLDLGLQVLKSQAARNGSVPPRRYTQLHLAAQQAAADLKADMRTSTDVRRSPTSAVSESGEVVGVAEAARLFGVGQRQARRIVEQAGGTKTYKGWRIDSLALQAEYDLRRAA